MGRELEVLRYQQQGAAADFSVVQLVVLERGGRDAQHVGELRPAEAEALPQQAKALAAGIIERGDGQVALVGTLFHGLGPVVVKTKTPARGPGFVGAVGKQKAQQVLGFG